MVEKSRDATGEAGIRSAAPDVRPAFLLLGPTGSGKTPLGDHLERQGLGRRSCAHFDFGAHLRGVASGRMVVPGLGRSDIEFLRTVLRDGVLLESEHFRIAATMLRRFLARRRTTEADVAIMNGLPRHVDQAEQVAALVRMDAVVYLQCTPECAYERIKRNTGGDRSLRIDDSLAEVSRKLARFENRTRPVLDHYAGRDVRMITVHVSVLSTPAEMAGQIVAGLETG